MNPTASPSLAKRLAAEAIAVMLVVAAIIGAGIMAQRLEGTGPALSLFVNSVVCGAMLVVVLVVLGPVSGGHLNPAWTILTVIKREMPAKEGVLYILFQVAGGCVGAILANVMFGQDPISVSSTVRSGSAMWVSEFVASFGLIGSVLGALRYAPNMTAAIVGLYIFGAYWFTGSSSFASPAATIGRTLSDSYAGIAPVSVPAYILAQILGAFAAALIFDWIFRPEATRESQATAHDRVLPPA